MAEPACPQKEPYVLELAPGDYLWCACGLSKNQPFCDRSHVGGPFKPKRFTLDKVQEVVLCGCKRTKDAPFCDDTHLTL